MGTVPPNNGSVSVPAGTTLPPSQQPGVASLREGQTTHLAVDIISARTGRQHIPAGTECEVVIPLNGTSLIAVRVPSMTDDPHQWFYVTPEELNTGGIEDKRRPARRSRGTKPRRGD